MNIEELKKEIPFKWRVQSYSKNKPIAICVAYIDSRDAQDLLDEVCTPAKWQCKYYEVKGNLFCSIGIKIGDEWVWKSDCGVESKEDGKKGEASDSFKRAFVKWGGGRVLYGKEIQYLKNNVINDGKNYPYVIDSQGKRVWDVTEECNKNNNSQPKETDGSDEQLLRKCKTLKELQEAFISLGKDRQEKVFLLKDELKTKLK